MLAKLTSKNQLTIPKAVLKQVAKAEYFEVDVRDDAILLRPAEVRPVKPVRAKPRWPEPVERVLQDFVRRVREAYGDRLVHVILYGSYARGDQRAHSDLDVLVVLRELPDGAFWEEFHRIGAWPYESSFGQGIPIIVSAMPADAQRFDAGATSHLEAAKRDGVVVA